MMLKHRVHTAYFILIKSILISLELVFLAMMLFWIVYFFINLYHIVFISFHVSASNFLTFVLNLNKIHFFSEIVISILVSLAGLYLTHTVLKWISKEG